MGKTKHEVVSEFRSAEILEAARRIFARKGFNGATMDDIADAAGLAKGTLYLYFPSKREVYLAAFRQGLAGLIEQSRRNMERAETAAEKIRAFISTRIRSAEENRDFVGIYHSEFASMGPRKEFRALYLEQARTLEAVLRQAIERGEIRPVRADAASVLIYETTRGMIMQRMMGWSKATADEDVEQVFELIWKGLTGQ